MVSGSNMKSRSISYAKYGYLFILPFFIIYAFFQIYPLFNTFYLSTQSNGSVITESVGTDNFRAILSVSVKIISSFICSPFYVSTSISSVAGGSNIRPNFSARPLST